MLKKTVLHIGLLILFIGIIQCKKDDGAENQTTTTITDENGDTQTVDTSQNNKAVGDAANDLLSGVKFDKLFFEIFYVNGFKPTDETIANFESFLSDRLHKPNGIEITLKAITTPGKERYSISEIRAMEDDIRTKYNKGKNIYVFGIFLDGEYAENTENGSVLGIAYRNTSFVIFENTIQHFSGKPLAPSTTVLETTVLNHEFGHLLGLVNAGSPPQSDHQDEPHGRHCTTENCLMYWTAETGEGLLNSISGGTIPTLDNLCLDDLKANGGK